MKYQLAVVDLDRHRYRIAGSIEEHPLELVALLSDLQPIDVVHVRRHAGHVPFAEERAGLLHRASAQQSIDDGRKGEHARAYQGNSECSRSRVAQRRLSRVRDDHTIFRLARTALASFLVLFLEVALIRWMPAHIRLLSFFSNFILLGSFLGIGLGCLRAGAARRWFGFFPLILFALVVGVFLLRLEVAAPPSPGSIYFSSGTKEPVVVIESTLLLPVIFLAVVALFVAVAERMGREMAAQPPLAGYMANIVGSLAGVAAFAVLSWLQLPPSVWFGVAGLAALPLLATADPGGRLPARSAFLVNGVLLAGVMSLAHLIAAGSLWSPYYKISVSQQGPDTVIEVNNIFHQSMAPIAQKEYFYQWPYAVFGDRFENVLILGAGSGTDVAAALAHGAKHVDAVEIDPTIIRLGRDAQSGSSVQRSARHHRQRRRASLSAAHGQEVRPGGLRAHRLPDAAVGLLRRPARELHVHARSRSAPCVTA